MVEKIASENGDEHLCRVVSFVEGRLFSEIDHRPSGLLESLGRKVAEVDRALSGVSASGHGSYFTLGYECRCVGVGSIFAND